MPNQAGPLRLTGWQANIIYIIPTPQGKAETDNNHRNDDQVTIQQWKIRNNRPKCALCFNVWSSCTL